jgi:hypothetical protein
MRAIITFILTLVLGCRAGNKALLEEDLGFGYTRIENHIFFEHKRIDWEGWYDIWLFQRAVGHSLTLASNVDAKSFKALSSKHSKDKN